MEGREDNKMNDLFFVCSLIEYVARKTKNERKTVVNAMGKNGIRHYYELADVYHCENIDKLTRDIVTRYHIPTGTYDNVGRAEDSVPSHWDIGKVMHRLIHKVASESGSDIIDALIAVYNSWIVKKIDDYNCSMYYDNTSYQYASYKAGHAL